ncbi:hypothetical protein DV735_g508, partial [Chaetothyriales sp. CBS 134920]
MRLVSSGAFVKLLFSASRSVQTPCPQFGPKYLIYHKATAAFPADWPGGFPGLTSKGWQVLVVDYNNTEDLKFKLAGAHTVISTVSGTAQLNLIDAAASVDVRRFVPSEFGGPPTLRPEGDPLDNQHRAAILKLLQLESRGMSFTVFTCGILYERFAPGGSSSSQIAVNSAMGKEGKYILDIRQRRAQLPYNTLEGRSAKICLTGARDVAHCIVSALDHPSWPREFRVRGARMSLRQLILEAEHALNCRFQVSQFTRTGLSDAITFARAVRDEAREMQLHHLAATAEGRYDFTDANLNQAVNHRPEKFRDYLARVWAPA